MLKTIDIDRGEFSLSEMVRLIKEGTEVLLVDKETPLARLTPVDSTAPKRVPGLFAGQIWIRDDFDDPLPESFWLGEDEPFHCLNTLWQ
ncbi:MAG: hypothetical protein DWI57_13050 [Chloroflexi bacterium]|nr:MAG: hypothetical protein DWI57_13050 [Chloroflexota bacterium]